MLNYLRLPCRFDAISMQHELAQWCSGNWQQHYQKLHYEGNWSAIPLRSVGGKSDDIFISPVENAGYLDTAFLQQSPYLQQVLAYFKCPLLAVRMLKLDAGALIKEHRDADLCYEKGEVRLHIPVITHPDVEFYSNRERIDMKEGECWYINFNLTHSIRNNSPVNRVHLVIDAKVNDFIHELFADPSITIKKESEVKQGPDDSTKKMMIENLRAMNTATSLRMADELEKELAGTTLTIPEQ